MTWTLPKTWNVGDVLTSTDMNTYVRDNSNYLYGDTARVPVPLAANWVNFGSNFAPLSVIRTGSQVHLFGMIKNNTGATAGNGVVVGTVPSAYIPPDYQPSVADANGAFCRLDIQPSGNITPTDMAAGIVNGGFLALNMYYSLV